MEIKITDEVKQILNDYDVKDLLTYAINITPQTYKQMAAALDVYKKKARPKYNYNIDEEIINSVQRFNLSAPISLIFNFLIETVCDCSRINTKNIKTALDCYYYAVAHDHTLLSKILNKYSESSFYNEQTGLSEEAIAYFLTTSIERTKYLKKL
jgi:hypothetical protein